MFGLDPFFAAIIALVASAGGGWLTGPILGTAVFNLLHGNVREEMAAVRPLLQITGMVRC